jgi:hypothetical protein
MAYIDEEGLVSDRFLYHRRECWRFCDRHWSGNYATRIFKLIISQPNGLLRDLIWKEIFADLPLKAFEIDDFDWEFEIQWVYQSKTGLD